MVAQTAVRAKVVVKPGRGRDVAKAARNVQKLSPKAVFLFQDAVQALRKRVFAAVILLRHAQRDVRRRVLHRLEVSLFHRVSKSEGPPEPPDARASVSQRRNTREKCLPQFQFECLNFSILYIFGIDFAMKIHRFPFVSSA